VVEVGTHLVDVSVAGHKLGTGTLLAKGYNSALIRVTDVSDAVVGQPCQFRGQFKRICFNNSHLFWYHNIHKT